MNKPASAPVEGRNNQAEGRITQIIGPVIDVEFPRESIPHVYEALKLKDVDLTLEVQQQLGDGIVRTIAMGASEGLKRGLAVAATGAPISVPVGKGTLGRIMDVLGHPQDNQGPVKAETYLPIHRPLVIAFVLRVLPNPLLGA